MSSDPETIAVLVSPEELALLKKLDFPCSEEVLNTARHTDEGIELVGSRFALDDLVGWVAGEANYCRKNNRPRQTRLLDSIADNLEAALSTTIRF